MQTDLSGTRCDLVPVSHSDAMALHALWTAPGVRRFLWDGEIISRERTDEAIATSDDLFEQRDFGLWLMRERIDHSLIGFAGLWPFRESQECELVFGVDERMWGHGYATEGGQAVIKYCFHALNMPRIDASSDVDNTASIRVLEKLGFAETRREVVNRIDTVFFEKHR